MKPRTAVVTSRDAQDSVSSRRPESCTGQRRLRQRASGRADVGAAPGRAGYIGQRNGKASMP
jgi:hypothetical protein